MWGAQGRTGKQLGSLRGVARVRQPRALTCPEVGSHEGTFALGKVAQFA